MALSTHDEFLEDEVILGLRDRAYRLHNSALIYCARNLTDGDLTARAVKVLAAILNVPVKGAIAELVTAGLWEKRPDGAFFVPMYLAMNPPAEVVEREREKARKRMADLRARRAGVDEPPSPEGGSRERSPEHTPERSRAVPPPPSPDLGVLEVQAPTSFDAPGRENLWRRLIVATGVRDPGDVLKLHRAVTAHQSTDREVECAIEAATGPNVRDRLAVALSELVKLAKERRSAA